MFNQPFISDMKHFLCGLILGVITNAVFTQGIPNEDIEYPAYPSVVILDSEDRYHILVDSLSSVPNNSTHVANIDASCLTGGKNCKYPLKVLRIN